MLILGVDAEQGKEGGTWFAMSKTGKIAALLNVLQPDDEIAVNKKGRGKAKFQIEYCIVQFIK